MAKIHKNGGEVNNRKNLHGSKRSKKIQYIYNIYIHI